jgi:hypothetical protein
MTAHRVPVISAAVRNNVPAVYLNSYFAREGGLLSYGPDPVDTFRRAASYVDRILRGEKPGDLPVQFPTKFEMVVNLKTAKALGLAIPRRSCCAPTKSSNNCWLCRFMALSWLNLPCALKAGIGIGKRTLGDPRQSAAPQGRSKGLGLIGRPGADARPRTAGWRVAWTRPRL